MKYEVYNCRNDVNVSLYCCFCVESDEQALVKFEEMKKDKSLAWDYLTLIKVIQERIVERLAHREP